MTILICTGTLFSNWHEIAKLTAVNDPKHNVVCENLSVFSKKICQKQFPDSDELSWRPFSPSDEQIDSTEEMFLSAKDEDFFSWADSNCSLFLNFWQSTFNNPRFILFYSSPEHELGSYLSENPFDESNIERIMQAWLVRTRAMLAFFMANRNQCLLVNVKSANSERRLFARAANEHLNLTIPVPAKKQSENMVLLEYLATSLLQGNELVSELYDEVRSAATVICERDKSIIDIQSRSRSLINAFLKEAASHTQLMQTSKDLGEDLYLQKIQVSQLMEELEFHYKSNQEESDIFASYIGSDPLLNIARQVRKSK